MIQPLKTAFQLLYVGQLGIGKKVMVTREMQHVAALKDETVVKIAAGARNSFAVTASGRVYTW